MVRSRTSASMVHMVADHLAARSSGRGRVSSSSGYTLRSCRRSTARALSGRSSSPGSRRSSTPPGTPTSPRSRARPTSKRGPRTQGHARPRTVLSCPRSLRSHRRPRGRRHRGPGAGAARVHRQPGGGARSARGGRRRWTPAVLLRRVARRRRDPRRWHGSGRDAAIAPGRGAVRQAGRRRGRAAARRSATRARILAIG